MSRAFVHDAEETEGLEELPDRLISAHPNYVTKEGLKKIEAEVARLSEEYAAAQRAADRQLIANVGRDLRYWTARRDSAEVVAPPPGHEEVHFGMRVTVKRSDGRKHTYRIVGEDEADPSHGSIPYVSPLARALMGRRVGDVVHVGDGDAEILKIA